MLKLELELARMALENISYPLENMAEMYEMAVMSEVFYFLQVGA